MNRRFLALLTLALMFGARAEAQTLPIPVTPRACGGTTTVATGGTAVTVALGPMNGGFVYNPPDAASQGIGTAENLYVDSVGTPLSTGGNGTTTTLLPGGSFTIQRVASGVTVKMNAATSGHKVTALCW